MDKLAIIILNWNGANLLQEFLPQVIANSQVKGVSIWVADNASSDNSIDILKNSFPDVKHIKLDRNYGFAGGYNRAIKSIKAEYVVLLNSDAAPEQNWLPPLIEMMDSNSNIAACAPKLLDYKRKEYFEYAGAAGGFIDKYGYVFCRGRIFNNIEKDNAQYETPIEIFWGTGAALCIRREIYLASGGLDEDFFAHMEEIDLCWRLKNQGYKIMYQPESTVYHLGGATLNKSNPRKTYLNFRNNLLMMYKNIDGDILKSVMFKRMMLDGLAAAMMLLKFKFSDFKAIWKAHTDYRKMLKKSFVNKRKYEQSISVRTKHPEIIMRNMVWCYFTGKVKKFSDLGAR